VSGRGELAAATAPLALAITIATFGLPDAITYFIAKSPSLLRFVTLRGLVFVGLGSIVATSGVWLAAPWLAQHNDELRNLIRIAAFGIPISLLLACIRAIAAGLFLWSRVTSEKAISAIVRLGSLGVLFAIGQLTPLNATIAVTCTYFVGALAYIGMRLPRHPSMPGQFTIRTSGLLGYGGSVWFGSLAGIVLARIDQVLMTPLSGNFQLGIYAVAVNVGEVILVFNSAVRDVVFSAQSAQDDEDKLTMASRLSTIVTLGAAIIVGSLTPLMLPLIFGTSFAPAIPVVLILLLAAVLGNPGSVAGAGLSARGKAGLRSLSLGIACLINIGVLLLLVPVMGAVGAAVATLLGNVVSSNLNIVFLWRRFGISPIRFYKFTFDDLRALSRRARGIMSRGR
jgi:O-antigen/teichoic acid export membrane protein